MTLLTAADYPAIRSAIDVRLTETDLPDSTIKQDIYLGAADRELKDRDPDWASRSGDGLLRLKAAAVFLTAARLVYAVVNVSSLSIQARDMSYSRPAFNAEKRDTQLRNLAELELQELLTPDEQAARMPAMFRLAHGTRGK